MPKSALLENQSQVALEQLQLVRAKSQREIALLSIQQLLEIEANTDFDILVPSIQLPKQNKVPSTQEIYAKAIEVFPNVKSATFRLKSTDKYLAISKGARLPRISLNGAMGSGYSDARTRILGVDSLGMMPSGYQTVSGENICV